MGKLNLVIIDRDIDYVNCVSDYLISEQAQNFFVSTYTEESAIAEFIAAETEMITDGIFLVCREFYEQVLHKEKGLVILLADEVSIVKQKDEGRAIYKYQYGNRLVAEILKIFAEEGALGNTFNNGFARKAKGKKHKIIGVYSPIGGVGKTTIAVGACIQSAWEGKNVFYLNLENIATTPLYFQGKQEESLSNILYYLKCNSPNLCLQIEGAKCVDPLYNIHFFQPPDSSYDFTEDVSQELCCLLQELRKSRQYDLIFIDFSSAINKNNLAVLRNCDDLLLVAEENFTSVVKIKCLLKELHLLLSREEETELRERFNLVLNKTLHAVVDNGEELNITINQKGVLSRIPLVENLTIFQDGVFKLDLNSSFGKAIYQLLLNF